MKVNIFQSILTSLRKRKEEKKLKKRKAFFHSLLEEIEKKGSFHYEGLAFYWNEKEKQEFGEYINQNGGVNKLIPLCERVLKGPEHYKKFLENPLDYAFSEDINLDSHFLKMDLHNFLEEFPQAKNFPSSASFQKREEVLLLMKGQVEKLRDIKWLSEEEYSLKKRYESYLSYLFGELSQKGEDYKIFRFGYFNKLKECDFLEKNAIDPKGIEIAPFLIKKAQRKKIIDASFLERIKDILNDIPLGVFSLREKGSPLLLMNRKFFDKNEIGELKEKIDLKEYDKFLS